MSDVIYRAKGRAAEYCALAASMYRGCGHGCVYCYGPEATKTQPLEFFTPRPRSDVLRRLQKDASKLRRNIDKAGGKPTPVLMSFSCDPYQPLDSELRLTREAIKLLHHHGMPVMLLTKGGVRALRDFDLLGPEDWFGVTLTCLDYPDGREWEPHAAPYDERVNSLLIAHKRGIKTWVSLEPVIYPEVSKMFVQDLHPWVDHWKVGKLNYHPRAQEIDWAAFAMDIKDLLDRLGCDYYLKEGLRELLDHEVRDDTD